MPTFRTEEPVKKEPVICLRVCKVWNRSTSVGRAAEPVLSTSSVVLPFEKIQTPLPLLQGLLPFSSSSRGQEEGPGHGQCALCLGHKTKLGARVPFPSAVTGSVTGAPALGSARAGLFHCAQVCQGGAHWLLSPNSG